MGLFRLRVSQSVKTTTPTCPKTSREGAPRSREQVRRPSIPPKRATGILDAPRVPRLWRFFGSTPRGPRPPPGYVHRHSPLRRFGKTIFQAGSVVTLTHHFRLILHHTSIRLRKARNIPSRFSIPSVTLNTQVRPILSCPVSHLTGGVLFFFLPSRSKALLSSKPVSSIRDGISLASGLFLMYGKF